jgi:hypothetical protein
MTDNRIEKFISKLFQWASYNHNISKKNIKKLTPVLRKYLYNDFKNKNNDLILSTRELENTKILNLSYQVKDFFIINNKKENIEVGVLLPNWSRGLRNNFRHEDIYDYISYFFHFAEQYLKRAKYTEVMGGIALVYNTPTSFSNGRMTFVHDSHKDDIKKILDKHNNSKINMFSRKQILFTKILSCTNGYDHFIHKILFNYIKALELSNANFLEETMTALDKTVNIAEQILRERHEINEKDQKLALCKFLSLSQVETKNIKYLYELRNYFGSHPSASKWWDFSELYPESEETFFNVVSKIIIKILELESKNRTVTNNHNDWYNWFFDNWEMLWNTVWFEKIP